MYSYVNLKGKGGGNDIGMREEGESLKKNSSVRSMLENAINLLSCYIVAVGKSRGNCTSETFANDEMSGNLGKTIVRKLLCKAYERLDNQKTKGKQKMYYSVANC